ncbi:MAG: MarR family transcriptional regulator [Bryobacteraceae bacterium]
MPLALIPDIHRATHQIGLHIAQCPGLAITQGEAHILVYLHDHGPATVGEVHSALSHKRSTLTSLLNRLDERRFAVRELHPGNRKTFLIRLTPSGKKAAAKVRSWLQRYEQKALAGLNGEQVESLRKILARFDASAVHAML